MELSNHRRVTVAGVTTMAVIVAAFVFAALGQRSAAIVAALLPIVCAGGASICATSLVGRVCARNEELRRLDRLKDDLIASVSHELRNPLTSIRGYLELVLAQVEAGEIALECRMTDLDQLVREAVEAARPLAAEHEVEIELDAERMGLLNGDPARLAQSLDNLVMNALKFTPPGGRVDVRTSLEGGVAVLEVADTGIGISEEDQQRLFQRFFRAEGAILNAIEGTGLGLAIAKAIIDSHGGRLSVRSTAGLGTTFRMELPTEQAADGVRAGALRSRAVVVG